MGLRVLLGETLVGRIRCDDSRLAVLFQFDEGYLELRERPVLGRYFEDFELDPSREFLGPGAKPPNFFRNCLPEGALRKLVEQQVERWRFREFALLERLGRDLPGNVILLPDDIDAMPEEESAPAPAPPPLPPGTVRMSVAGVQPKVSVSKVHERVTVPASGLGGRWFAKLPTPAFPSLPENEFVTLEWARRSGIQVPHASLYPANKIENLPAAFDINGPNALLVERFDRQGQTRIHQEDFAQILNIAPDEKYDGEVPADVDYSTIGRIVQVASEGRDTPEFLRRIAFMILSGNADAHVKNWSLTYPDGRRPRLAPAYDLVATIAYPGVGAGLALRLGEGYPLEITASDLVAFAETCGMDVDEASSVLREFVARARTEWDGVRSLAEMPEQVRDAVDGRLAATKL